MKIPILQGMIKRRMLINFRVDAPTMQKFLPAPFRPKLQLGNAIAGICLIRLEHIRPAGWPVFIGLSSENAAHRIAVEWKDSSGEHEGVFIPRRDTNSALNYFTGGRIFSGEHHLAKFDVTDDGSCVDFAMRSNDGTAWVCVSGFSADALPSSSCFSSIGESSRYFERGSLGYSVTRDPHRLDGLKLETREWRVHAFAIEQVQSSFFANTAYFPAGSVEFDHALIMRDMRHEWHQANDMAI